MKHGLRLVFALLLLATPALAADIKPDDTITLNLTSEDWVSTQTARAVINVEAVVVGGAGAARASMIKAVNDTAKADWKLIAFNRSEDQTGLERWNAQYEARMPEGQLSGLYETVKKNSKAGMKLTVATIDFSPTLDEVEAVNAGLRVKLLKQVADQLKTINGTMPDRQYRVSQVNFNSSGFMPPQPMPMMYAKAAMADMAVAASPEMGGGSMERSQKIQMTANVVLAAIAPVTK